METSRKAALLQGQIKFFTGKPCKYGHIAHRYVKSGNCSACATNSYKTLRETRGWQHVPKTAAAIKRWTNSAKGRAARDAWRSRNPKLRWVTSTLTSCKRRAKVRGLACNLTNAYLRGITPDECPVFGTPFSFVGNEVASSTSPSLDRLDPALGYVEGNVVVISMKANSIKSAYGADDIRRVADWLSVKGYY